MGSAVFTHEQHESSAPLSVRLSLYIRTDRGTHRLPRSLAVASSIPSAEALARRSRQRRMESRVGIAACCLLMLLVLSAQQQQVAGLSKFCRCYRDCYTECRKTTSRYPCNANCFQDCIKFNRMLPPAAPTTVPATCHDICLMGFCGSMEVADDGAMAGDAEACVTDCTKNLGAFAPSAAKINK